MKSKQKVHQFSSLKNFAVPKSKKELNKPNSFGCDHYDPDLPEDVQHENPEDYVFHKEYRRKKSMEFNELGTRKYYWLAFFAYPTPEDGLYLVKQFYRHHHSLNSCKAFLAEFIKEEYLWIEVRTGLWIVNDEGRTPKDLFYLMPQDKVFGHISKDKED